MDRRIKNIAKELGVEIEFDSTLDKPGHYVAALNLIVINGNMDDFDTKKALLHELGHASRHKNNYFMYKLAFSLHSTMEREAERYMIKELLEEYISSSDIEIQYMNYMNFIEGAELDVSYESMVRELFLEHAYSV